MISVIVNTFSGGRQLQRCIEALLPQADGEVIVPVCDALDPVDDLRRRYPSVRFVETGLKPTGKDADDPGFAHLIYCRRRAAGLATARGEIIALTEDQVIPDSNWCAAILAAHRDSYAAIGGAVENAGEGILHQALHLFDFGIYQKPLSPGEVSKLTDQNVSYKRIELEKIRIFGKTCIMNPPCTKACERQEKNCGSLRFRCAVRPRPPCIWTAVKGALCLGTRIRRGACSTQLTLEAGPAGPRFAAGSGVDSLDPFGDRAGKSDLPVAHGLPRASAPGNGYRMGGWGSGGRAYQAAVSAS